MAATLKYGKTKYVSIISVTDLDILLHYLGGQVSPSGPSGPLVRKCVQVCVSDFNKRNQRLTAQLLTQEF